VEIWPENELPFEIFVQLRTQWRMGMGGPIGLDYGVLYHKLDRMQLDPEQYAQVEADIRVMEEAALDAMSRKE